VLEFGTPLYPGALRLIEKLSRYGFEIGIATMKPDDLAEVMVRMSKIKKFIRYVQGSTGLAPKPDPEVLTKIRQRFGGRPLVMVGDRFEDIICAKNANSMSIGIGQTVVPKLDLLSHGAFAAFESLEELHEQLDQLLEALSLEFERSQYLGIQVL
jgi:phosphoglycolate phosphatase-like HAD superfamily hydrolase